MFQFIVSSHSRHLLVTCMKQLHEKSQIPLQQISTLTTKEKFVRTQQLFFRLSIVFIFYFRHMLQFVIFSKRKYLTRSLIYVHKFGVSHGQKWLEQHNKTLEHCIATILYLDSLSSLFSSKYCYGIIMDELNMNNIKHHENINTHSQITKNNIIEISVLLFFFSKKAVHAAVKIKQAMLHQKSVSLLQSIFIPLFCPHLFKKSSLQSSLTFPSSIPQQFCTTSFLLRTIPTIYTKNIFLPPVSQFRLDQGTRDLGNLVRTDTVLISPFFLKVWTAMTGLTITDSSLLRLRKLVYCRQQSLMKVLAIKMANYPIYPLLYPQPIVPYPTNTITRTRICLETSRLTCFLS